MKNITKIYPAVALLAWLASAHALATAPESEIYPAYEIHHYAVNRGASTVSVFVPSYYRFQNDHYVMVPSHAAEAPLPHDRYSAAYWIPGSTAEAGHWAR